ncbi:extracellular solute-binding protein [Paenibacillus hemerocallicola]|uniref:Extracellular solute-binding protein n=1 Tax=Paenibacillus hemerocallicola TaxID=1172614 RepID=A0A5C4SWI9_9BACL|nr:extracellular solute-binding protein [Paenibacillus hemerocallicola]TNJ59399.1 extracellular solute-binding protein [Paenibacillus hemerocallicola]
MRTTEKIRRTSLAAIGLAILVACAAACGQKAVTNEEAKPRTGAETQKEPEPVTLRVFNPNNYAEILWNDLWVAPMKKKFPHITLVNVKNEKGSTLKELVAAGNAPDLIQGSGAKYTFDLEQLGLLYDMAPMIKSQKFDLNRITPLAMEGLKPYFDNNKIYGLPITMNNTSLYYNKDIFDKFAVPYPKDGITYDEVYELAKRLTREEGGIQYRGFEFASAIQMQYNQLSLPLVRNDQAAFNTDGWKNWFNTMKRFYELEGMQGLKTNATDAFLKDKTLAMYSVTNIMSTLATSGLNWDMATMPTFAQAPKKGMQVFGPILYVSSTSKHKEEAFSIIAHFLSDEVQIQRARGGEPTVMKNADIKQQFGADRDYLKGKNVGAFLANDIAPSPEFVSKYDVIAAQQLDAAFWDVVNKKSDVNTAIRLAEENANKKIAEEKTK